MPFTVLLHHYGRFTSPPGRKFEGGLTACVNPVDFETFSVDQLKLILTNCLGYDEKSPTFFYIKKPNCSLDSGLVPLTDAIEDRESLLTYTRLQQNKLHVYVSRVALAELFVPNECTIKRAEKNMQDKPSCSKKLFE